MSLEEEEADSEPESESEKISASSESTFLAPSGQIDRRSMGAQPPLGALAEGCRESSSSEENDEDMEGLFLFKHVNKNGGNVYLGVVFCPNAVASGTALTNPFYGQAIRIESTTHPEVNAMHHLIGVQMVSERCLVYDFEDGWILQLMKRRNNDVVYLLKRLTSIYHMVGTIDREIRRYAVPFSGGEKSMELNELIDFIQIAEDE